MAKIIIAENEYDSYATLDDANKYFAAKFSSNWTNIPEEDKKKLLITATREMEGFEYQGCKVEPKQEMQFPRFICYCQEETSIDPTKELIACCCEIANALYNAQSTIDLGIVTPNAENIKSMTVGTTSVTYQDKASVDSDIFKAISKPLVQKYLKQYLVGSIKVYL